MTAPDPQDRLRSMLARVPTAEVPVDDIVAAGERRRRTRRARLAGAGAAAAVVVVAVAALAVDQGPPDVETVTYPSPVDVAGDWRVSALYADTGREVRVEGLAAPVELRFDPSGGSGSGEPTVSGNDGCNDFGGPYAAAGDQVTVASDEVVGTEIGCARTVPLVERLGDVRTARTDGVGIELLDGDREVVVELQPLDAEVDLVGAWDVTDLVGADGRDVDLDRLRPTLTFSPGTGDLEAFDGGCNVTTGLYRQVGDELTIEGEDLTTSRNLCGTFTPLGERLPDAVRVWGDGPDAVQLRDVDGRLVARLVRDADGASVDLDGTWRVAAAPDLDARLRPTLVRVAFDLPRGEGTALVSGDCNDVEFGLDVRTDGALVTMSPRAWRQPSCSAIAVAEQLEEVASVRPTAGEVELLDTDGDLVVRLAPVSR